MSRHHISKKQFFWRQNELLTEIVAQLNGLIMIPWKIVSIHDLSRRRWLKCRAMLMFALGNRYDVKQARKHTHNVCWWPLENFLGPFKVKHHVCKNTIFEDFNQFRAKNCLWMGMKSKKWPLAYVCDCKMWLKCRAMLMFALGDRYGVNQTNKHPQ